MKLSFPWLEAWITVTMLLTRAVATGDESRVAAAIAEANRRHPPTLAVRTKPVPPPRERERVQEHEHHEPEPPKREPKKPRPLTYSEAYDLSLETKKPLLVWVSGNFCPRCVNESKDEFVHCFVDSFPGAVAPSIAVCVPKDGQLMVAGNVTQWIVGDAEYGHIPTVRKTVRKFLESGLKLRFDNGGVKWTTPSGTWSSGTYRSMEMPVPSATFRALPTIRMFGRASGSC